MESMDDISSLNKNDHEIISQILTELYITSENDKKKINNISKELLQHFPDILKKIDFDDGEDIIHISPSDSKSLKAILEEFKDIIASKLSLENQIYLKNIISSMGNVDDIIIMNRKDHKMITKIITELNITSQKETNLSKMVQHITESKFSSRESTETLKSETKPLKIILQEFSNSVSSKLAPEKMNILSSIISSMGSMDDINMLDIKTQEIISQIIMDLHDTSEKNKSPLKDISKEMLHHFIEKVSFEEEKKVVIETFFIDDIETLMLDLDIEEIDDEKKNALLTRIKDLTKILQNMTNRDKIINKRIESIIQRSATLTVDLNKHIPRKKSLQTHKMLNEVVPSPLIKTWSEEELETKRMRNAFGSILKHYNISTMEDLTHPDKIVDDLIFQKKKSFYDPDKIILLSQALFDITQEKMNKQKDLMEVIASNAFSNLIIDMQNVLSHSLKQYEMPLALKRCTTNLLLLQSLGIFGLDDFEQELQKFETKYPDEITFSKNPLILSQLSKDFEKLNLSKNEIKLDNSLTFLRNVDSLKPVDRAKAIEMGLIVEEVDEIGRENLKSILFSEIDVDTNLLPKMFSVEPSEQKELINNYRKKIELKDHMMGIENLIRENNIRDNMIRMKPDSLDSVVNMVRDEVPGSKMKLLKMIKNNEALNTIANIGTVLDLHLKPKPKLDTGNVKLLKLKKDVKNKSIIRSPTSRKLPPLIKTKKGKSIKAVDGFNLADIISKKKEKYGSVITLRSRIKDEICKIYPFLEGEMKFDDSTTELDEDIIPKTVKEQTREFHRLFGTNTTILPFIGKSKSDVGSVLDQGLRALHFDLGPGTLVRAILDKERNIINIPESRDPKSTVSSDSSKTTKKPLKYLTNTQLKHCRMTNRPGYIPIHEWAKVAVPGTYQNLKPDLFNKLHPNEHCAHSMLAEKHIHRHGISIVKHLERYQLMEIVNKSVQENAYVRIQNSLLKCLIRVLDEK